MSRAKFIAQLTELWLEEFAPVDKGGYCCLCGNHGTIDTRGKVFTPKGVECGAEVFCICPNGRRCKEAAEKIASQVLKGGIHLKP